MSEDTPTSSGEPGSEPPSSPSSEPEATDDGDRRRLIGYVVAVVITALATVAVVALLTNIFERRHEGRTPHVRVVEVDESTTDPAEWGKNWPRQYESYKRTVDHERTRYGGSDAIPRQKLDYYPWLRLMWSGYAFSLDYREARGHAYMLVDQEQTRRVLERDQPGACLHCHASVIPAYRFVGDGDVMEGFRTVSGMDYQEARNLVDDDGDPLIEHPASCVDCHNPETMEIRVTRPGFINGIAAYKENQEGIEDYQVNRDATRQEMRSFVCGQCHVEYYFAEDTKEVVYPWEKGLTVEDAIEYYDEIDFSDWTHGYTGGRMLKAQHPEFEIYNQGSHAQAGVACADCHMPYKREGAAKVSDHHVRSPLLNISRTCQTCHNVPEDELRGRAHAIQDRTSQLIDHSAGALEALMHEIVAARESGADDEDLAEALKMQRHAQFRLDYVFSENSHGFHAPQETARILALSIDESRRGQMLARELRTIPLDEIKAQPAPIQGVTPDDEAPPGPYQERPAQQPRPSPEPPQPSDEEEAGDESDSDEEADEGADSEAESPQNE